VQPYREAFDKIRSNIALAIDVMRDDPLSSLVRNASHIHEEV
jgi:hypothetical protein